MSTFLVFFYGTLKKNQPNHYLLSEGLESKEVEYVGEGYLAEKRPLVIASSRNLPFVLDVPGAGHNVKGEIYSLNQRYLDIIDGVERHPHFYERTALEVIRAEASRSDMPPPLTCNVYLFKRFKPFLLDLPYRPEYSDGVDGIVYVRRQEGEPPIIPEVMLDSATH